MYQQINQTLAKLEKEHGVHICFAVEAGSRLWGMESNDGSSDYDIRGVFCHPPRHYWGIDQLPQTLNWMSEDRQIDINLHDIRKFGSMLYKGNVQAVEWLYSHIPYRENDLRAKLFEYVTRHPQYGYLYQSLQGWAKAAFLSAPHCPDANHEIRYYSTKRLLYATRLLLAARKIFDYEMFYALRFSELLAHAHFEDEFSSVPNEIIRLLELKVKGSEKGLVASTQIPDLLRWLDVQLGHIRGGNDWGNRAQDKEKLNTIIANGIGEYAPLELTHA